MNRIEGNLEKFGLFILSLWLMFIFMIILWVRIEDTQGVIYGWKEFLKVNWPLSIAIFFMAWGAWHYLRFNTKIKGANELATGVISVENINSDHLIFLTTYIVPLVSLNLTQVRYIIVFFGLVIVIGVIYVKTNMFYANPTLALIGYQVYKVNICPNNNLLEGIVVITREKIEVGDRIRYKQLDQNIYFAKKASS